MATVDHTASRALETLSVAADLAAPYELAGLVDACARQLGASGATVYLVDLQQHMLVAHCDPAQRADEDPLPSLSVDATLAGRAFQSEQRQVGGLDADGVGTAWLPLVLGTSRVGVLGVDLQVSDGELAGPPWDALEQLASKTAALLVAKEPYGDTLVRLRRLTPLSLPAELQYAILPPLSFASRSVTVSAALEPCYEVAGDAIDYAVDDGRARFAIFDGMGHGLHSAQCAVFTVIAYRNARRRGQTLVETLSSIDAALTDGLGGEIFTTAILAELDTRTGVLQWVNAGHPAPLLLRGGKVVRHLTTEAEPPIGLGNLLPGRAHSVGQEQLEPGDLVLLYTDGVVEARSPGGEFFGVDRLADLVVRHLAGGLAPPETMRRVVRELLSHHEGQLTDDATLLMLEWRSERATTALRPD